MTFNLVFDLRGRFEEAYVNANPDDMTADTGAESTRSVSSIRNQSE